MATANTTKGSTKAAKDAPVLIGAGEGDTTFKPLDINTATFDQMKGAPFMTNERAKLIYNYRQIHGPFASIDHVRRVNGIGAGMMQTIKDHFFVANEDSAMNGKDED